MFTQTGITDLQTSHPLSNEKKDLTESQIQCCARRYISDESLVFFKNGPTGAVVRVSPSYDVTQQADRQTDRQDHVLSQGDALTNKDVCKKIELKILKFDRMAHILVKTNFS